MTEREKEIGIAANKYCATTDPVLVNCGNHSFIECAKWADSNLKPLWISTKDKLPPEGVEVIAFHHKWVDGDFNPNGTRIGFLNGNGEFTSAYWWDYQDCYETINKSICEDNKDFYKSHIDNTEPEYWCYIPKLPKE